MQRKMNSKRTLKWIERNLLSNSRCKDYVLNLLNLYDIKDFEIYNDTLKIIINKKKYIIFFDYEMLCLICKNILTGKYNKYSNDSCWINCMKDIVRENQGG